MSKVSSPYARLLNDGRYECGVVQYGNPRTKDKLVPQGTVDTYEQALALIYKKT